MPSIGARFVALSALGYLLIVGEFQGELTLAVLWRVLIVARGKASCRLIRIRGMVCMCFLCLSSCVLMLRCQRWSGVILSEIARVVVEIAIVYVAIMPARQSRTSLYMSKVAESLSCDDSPPNGTERANQNASHHRRAGFLKHEKTSINENF
jgi:hypothetical protein